MRYQHATVERDRTLAGEMSKAIDKAKASATSPAVASIA